MNDQNKEKESSSGFNAAGYLMETALSGERNMREVLAGIYGAKDSYKAQKEQSDKQECVKESNVN